MGDIKLFKSIYSKAQTSTELAVFGAVLIFMLGMMIRYALSAGTSQSESLKAMRMAMATSLRAAETGKNRMSKKPGNASRNIASVLIVEDRLSAEESKFGVQSRSPFIVGASATFSKNLFMPIDYGEYDSLPRTDFFINGLHFQFTTAAFKEYNIQNDTDPNWIPDCNGKGNGCMALYSISPNLKVNTAWDPNACDRCKWNTCLTCFDLYRDGTTIVSPADRPLFTWQWQMVKATTSSINLQTGQNASLDVDNDLKEEQILEMVDIKGKRYTPNSKNKSGSGNVPIKLLRVLDFQEGDLDMTHNRKSPGAAPGFSSEGTQGWTYTRDGTYLQIEEGKIISATQNVKSTQRRNITDIVQRVVQLSRNTGFVCGTGSGAVWDAPVHQPNTQWNPDVEVCVPPGLGSDPTANCFSAANVYKTCFDEGSLTLYVRSRVWEGRGRKWVQDLGPRGY